MLKLEHSEAIGRVSVWTTWTPSASRRRRSPKRPSRRSKMRGRMEGETLRATSLHAVALVDYFCDEMRIMHGILTTWIKDILRYVVEHAGADDPSARCGVGRHRTHVGGLSHRAGQPRALQRSHRVRRCVRGNGLARQDAPRIQEPARDARCMDPGHAHLCGARPGARTPCSTRSSKRIRAFGATAMRALGSDDAARKAGTDGRGDARRPFFWYAAAAATWS